MQQTFLTKVLVQKMVTYLITLRALLQTRGQPKTLNFFAKFLVGSEKLSPKE